MMQCKAKDSMGICIYDTRGPIKSNGFSKLKNTNDPSQMVSVYNNKEYKILILIYYQAIWEIFLIGLYISCV